MRTEKGWFLGGLFLSTLAVLLLEILDARLLSVLTWYHLSFFAVSMAMLGISAGGIHVYLGGARFDGPGARAALARYAALFALSIPVCHVGSLCIPIKVDMEFSGTTVAGVVLTTVLISAPFYFAGVVVALSLTRVPVRIGLAYSVDLVGAALGCLLAIALLKVADISSAALFAGALAAAGAFCFARFAGAGQERRALWLTVVLLAAGSWNAGHASGFRVLFTKNRLIDRHDVVYEGGNTHSHVVVHAPRRGTPFYWGPGEGVDQFEAVTMEMIIDGEAATVMTCWDGDTAKLAWTQYDVTSLPYHLRRGGDAGVIGVGAGRDVLTAVWAESRSVTGVEVNDIFLHLLRGQLRDCARIADRPEVELVHDEARSYLTRQKGRFDVLQMSLIDTWASTGAGAFTLSENGLYTIEAWNVYLDALKPGGVFSASRWFSADHASETSRLLALGTAALLSRKAAQPAEHMALVSRGRVATLLVGRDPLTGQDLRRLHEAARKFGFTVHLAPGWPPADPALGQIVASRSPEALRAAIQNDVYDFTPPTDQRPYFFNMLKPAGVLHKQLHEGEGAMTRGNLLATYTLLLLAAVAAALVVAFIFVPLWRSGRTAMDRLSFTHALVYFGGIGAGYMMIQVPYIQRFSVYLGHPIYAMSVILFSMILFTGVGSLLSDRVPAERLPRWLLRVPLGIAGLLFLVIVLTQPVLDATLPCGLFVRCLVVILLTAPVSTLVGFCFPFGMRLLNRVSADARPWMWGVNGACGVLASVLAVGVSMWAGIHVSLYVALLLYAGLSVPGLTLWRKGAAKRDSRVLRAAVKCVRAEPAPAAETAEKCAAATTA